MPQWVEDCVKKVMDKGVAKDKAYAICWAEYKRKQEKGELTTEDQKEQEDNQEG